MLKMRNSAHWPVSIRMLKMDNRSKCSVQRDECLVINNSTKKIPRNVYNTHTLTTRETCKRKITKKKWWREKQQLVTYCIFSFPIFIFRLHADVLVPSMYFLFLSILLLLFKEKTYSAITSRRFVCRDKWKATNACICLFRRNSFDTCLNTYSGPML